MKFRIGISGVDGSFHALEEKTLSPINTFLHKYDFEGSDTELTITVENGEIYRLIEILDKGEPEGGLY